MNTEQFRTEIIQILNERKGDDYEITPNDVTKNNGVVLCGVTIKRKGRNIAPTIYLESYLADYESGITLDCIVNRIIYAEESAWDGEDFDYTIFADFEKIKDRLYVKLINTEKNEKLLSDVPSRQFLDLSLVVYCDVKTMCHMNASILVRNEHMNGWGVDAERLIFIAGKNTRSKGCTIKDIVEYFDCPVMPETDMMYVMTNDESLLGAVCMMYDDILDDFCIRHESGVYIIPSSIHEVLLIPENRDDEREKSLKEIVMAVNTETLAEEEILSDHGYYYSVSDGFISV